MHTLYYIDAYPLTLALKYYTFIYYIKISRGDQDTLSPHVVSLISSIRILKYGFIDYSLAFYIGKNKIHYA